MYVLWVMLAYMLLYLLRIIKGPTIWDRLLGMNLVASKIIIVIIAYASMEKTSYYLDFAIIYALSGFLGTIFVSLFLAKRKKGGKGLWRF